MTEIFDNIKFDSRGLLPAIAQDDVTGDVLMMAYMNREALEKTIETGTVHYYSRSRKELWMKGKSSGHTQKLKSIYLDCDGDTLLLKVNQEVAACHTGHRSCFFRKVEGDSLKEISEEIFDKETVYGR